MRGCAPRIVHFISPPHLGASGTELAKPAAPRKNPESARTRVLANRVKLYNSGEAGYPGAVEAVEGVRPWFRWGVT